MAGGQGGNARGAPAETYARLCEELVRTPTSWLVTGAAGFIGSHLVERLLALDQRVVGLDDFSTGSRSNLEDVRGRTSPERWRRFALIEGSIVDRKACRRALDAGAAGPGRPVSYVLHQAALASVPQSLADPARTNAVNVTGFLNVMLAAREAGVRRVVYASSSAVYGDDGAARKTEDRLGRPLSPYAASKRAGELYAAALSAGGYIEAVGLCYFNVYGPRQDPHGAYAAVIPRWIDRLLAGEPAVVFGAGDTTRDFCHIEDVVQANLLAAAGAGAIEAGAIFNIGSGRRTTLNGLYRALRTALRRTGLGSAPPNPLAGPPRAGDIRHSCADIGRARRVLGYAPQVQLDAGLAELVRWHAGRISETQPAGQRGR